MLHSFCQGNAMLHSYTEVAPPQNLGKDVVLRCGTLLLCSCIFYNKKLFFRDNPGGARYGNRPYLRAAVIAARLEQRDLMRPVRGPASS